MAKDEWDSPLDDSFNMDFDFDEVTEPKAQGRKPAKDAAKLLSKAVRGTSKGVFNQTATLVGRSMPNTSSAYREMRELALGGKGLFGELNKDVVKTVDSLKVTSRRLLPSIRKLMPSTIYDKIDRSLATDTKTLETNRKKMLEDERESIVANTIAETFIKTQQVNKAERDEERINKVIDRQMSISQFESSYRHLRFISTFFDTSFTAYLKKSIELKYKHLFVAQDTLEATRAMSTIMESKLENIKHNTGLPDIQKLHGMEAAKGAVYNKLFGKATERFGNISGDYVKKLLGNIKSNYIDNARSGLEQFAFAGEGIADGVEMMRDMEDMMPGAKESVGQKVGGFAAGMGGEWAGKKLANKHLKPILKKLFPLLNIAENVTENSREKMIMKMNELRSKFQHDPTFGPLFDNIAPDMSGDVRVSNPLLEKGGMAAPFDKASRTSLVEIIPGWLSKIAKNTRDLATGKDTEEEVYDFTKRDFVTVSSFKKNMVSHLYGNENSRADYGTTGVGLISASHNIKNRGKDKVDFNAIKKDIATFLLNHGLIMRSLMPDTIRKYTLDEPLEDYEDEYIESVFTEVNNPKQIAMVIVKTIYTSDDKLDREVVSAINDSIIRRANDDEYKSKFVNLFEVQGYKRYFKDDVDKYGNVSAASIRRNKLDMMGTKAGDKNIQYEGSNYLDKLIGRSKMNKGLMDEGILGNTDMFQVGTVIGDLLNRGVIDESVAQQVLAEYQNSNQFVSPDGPSVSSGQPGGKSRRPQFGRRGRSKGGTININKTVNSGINGSGVLNVRDENVFGILNSISDLVSNFSRPESAPSGGSTSPNYSNNTPAEAIRELKEVISKYNAEKMDIDYTLLDYVIQIHQKIKDGEPVTSDDKRKMSFLSKFGSTMAGNKTRVQSLLKNTWNKVASKAKTMYQSVDPSMASGLANNKFLRAGLGGLMTGGPLGAFLGYDSVGGFQRTKKMAGMAGSAIGGMVSGGMNLGSLLFQQGKGMFQSGKDKLKAGANKLLFIDIYRADNLVAGVPLITAKQQENREVIYNTGEIIHSSYLIDKPVIDLEGKTFITEEDLKVGLVDSNGKPINKLQYVQDKLKNMKKPSLGGIGDFLSNNKSRLMAGGLGLALGGPMLGLLGMIGGDKLKGLTQHINMKNLGGLGGLIAGGPLGAMLGYGLGAGASKIAGMGFGKIKDGITGMFSGTKMGDKVSDLLEDKKASPVKLIRSQFKLINDHLAKIEKNTSKRVVEGDSDGDGDRDGSYQDIMSKKKKSISDRIKLGASKVSGKMAGFIGSAIDAAKSAGGNALKWAGGALGGSLLTGGGVMAAGGTAAGTAAAGTAAATTVGATAGATAAAGGGVMAAATGVLASIPVAGWIALGVLAAGAGGYALYKYMKTSEGSNELLRDRIKAYKITPLEDIDYVRQLENRVYEFITKEEGPLTDKELNKYLDRFKIRIGDKSRAKFRDWLAHSFIPQFGAFLAVVDKNGKKYHDMKKIEPTDKEYTPIRKQMVSAMNSVKTSGPLFSELVKPKDDTEEKKEKADKTPTKDSNKKPTPVSKAINKVDKKVEVVDYKNAGKPKDAIKRQSVEMFRPKDDLYSLIEKGNDSQLRVLRNIHNEVRLLRLITEKTIKKEERTMFDSISDGVSGVYESGKRIAKETGEYWSKKLFTDDTAEAASIASMKHGVPKEYMLATSLIESRGGKNTNNTMYPNIKGPWQVSKGTAEFMKVNGNHGDPQNNADAAAKYYLWLKKGLKSAGIPATDANVYLAHQQGLGGISELFRKRGSGNSSLSDGLRKNLTSNNGGGMSPDDFINFVHSKYNKAAQAVRKDANAKRKQEAIQAEKNFQKSLPTSVYPEALNGLVENPVVGMNKI